MSDTRILLLLLAALLTLPGTPRAQESEGSAPPDAKEAAPPKPTLSDVSKLTQKQREVLDAIESRLAPDPKVVDLRERLAGATASREELEEEASNSIVSGAPAARLQKQREEAEALRKRLDEHARELDERFAKRGEDLEVLQSGRSSLGDAKEQIPDLPQALVAGIDSLLARSRRFEPRLTEKLNTIVELQGRVSSERSALTDLVQKLDAAIEREALEIVHRDSPFLWTALAVREPTRDEAAAAFLTLAEIRAYVAEHTDAVWRHAVLLVALAVAFSVLKRSASRREHEDPRLSRAAEILRTPVAAALVVGLLPTLWLHPLAPQDLVRWSYVAVALPLHWMLTRLVKKELRPVILVLIVAVVLGFLNELGSDPPSVVYRLGLLVLAGVGSSAFALLLRRDAAREAIAHERARGLVVLVARLGLVILLVAAVLDVVGFSRLAGVLARSTVMSVYFGLLMFLGVIVVGAFVDLTVHSRRLQKLRLFRNRTWLISRRIKGFVSLVGLVVWITVVLLVARLLSPLQRWTAQVLDAPAKLGDLQITLGDVLAFVLTFYVSLLIARFARFMLEEGVLPAVQLPRGVPGAVSRLSGYVIVTLGFLLALAASGFPLDRLTFMAGAFGLGLGFGLQNLIANFVSGLILLVERPIQVGDTIEFGTRTGRVTRIGIRSSVVRTWDGAEVNVPNGALVSNEVVNWTMSDRMRRLIIPVGVSYGTDPTRIPDILLPAATEHEGIADEPAPEVLFNGFGESSLDFELRCWTSSPDWIRFKSEITFAVHARLKEAGVEIPFPQRDLHLRSSSVAIGPKPDS